MPRRSGSSVARGFELIELVVVVAIIGILATVAYAYSRYGIMNANVSSAAYETALRLTGLRSTAMAENRDYLLVVADAQGNDASSCSWTSHAHCLELFVLRSPTASWSISSFDPASPGTNAELVEGLAFGRGVALDLTSAPARPDPFASVPLRDADLTATCATSRKCLAFRFRPNGDVTPEYSSSTQPRKLGHAFALGPTLPGTEHRMLVVSFPTGIVKSVAFSGTP